jgi:hypothetical protein
MNAIITHTEDWALRLQPATYRALSGVGLVLYLGVGDSARAIETREIAEGEDFTVPPTVNHYWYGLEALPAGSDPTDGTSPASIRRID